MHINYAIMAAIRRSFHQGGSHLIPFVKGVQPKKIYQPYYRRNQSPASQCEAVEKELEFDNTDYAFWAIVQHATNAISMAQCRACGTEVFSKKSRRIHQKVGGCAHKLVDEAKTRSKRKLCMICGNHCESSVWGWPLCKSMCVDGWKNGTLRSLHLIGPLSAFSLTAGGIVTDLTDETGEFPPQFYV